MRNKSVWEHACGLTRTVVERVEFDEGADAIVVSVRPVARARNGAGIASAVRRVMTLATVVAGGARWISGQRKCSSRRTRPGSGAASTG